MMNISRIKHPLVLLFLVLVGLSLAVWSGMSVFAGEPSRTPGEARRAIQDRIRTATLPSARPGEAVHVSAVYHYILPQGEGWSRLETWIDNEGDRAITTESSIDGAPNLTALVLGNREFKVLPGGPVIETVGRDSNDSHLLGPKSKLWYYRALFETGNLQEERGSNREAGIRVTGVDPADIGVKIEAVLDPHTLLLKELTETANGVEGRLVIEYEVVESIPSSTVPDSLFLAPPPSEIVKSYWHLNLDQARNLDFRVYYLGERYGGLEIRDIVYSVAPANTAYHTNPDQRVVVFYAKPGNLPGVDEITVTSHPLEDPDHSQVPMGAHATGEKTAVSVLVENVQVIIEGRTLLEAQRMNDAITRLN